MLTSLAFIFLVGLALAALCQTIKLPRIVGMLLTGIILGPYALNVLDSSILSISSQLRQIALILILLKAGLSLNLADLKIVGRPAILLSWLPASVEMLIFTLTAPLFLNISGMEAAVVGCVLAAASPAITIPWMIRLEEKKYGTAKRIPQMIMAGASCDAIFVIIIFSAFSHIAQRGQARVMDWLGIPISILLGITLGMVFGKILALFFETAYARQHCVRNSIKTIIILGVSFLLTAIETWCQNFLPISGLLAVVTMACTFKNNMVPQVSQRLSEKMSKLWLAAEVVLFVLVGAAVDIRYTLHAGLAAIAIILIALIGRCLGVCLSLLKTSLNSKERAFCVVSYIPKATVQAAIGSIPLSMGLSCGQIALSIAVLAILLTAPLGEMAIAFTYRKWLSPETKEVKDETTVPIKQ